MKNSAARLLLWRSGLIVIAAAISAFAVDGIAVSTHQIKSGDLDYGLIHHKCGKIVGYDIDTSVCL
jgi:hypothetical protein